MSSDLDVCEAYATGRNLAEKIKLKEKQSQIRLFDFYLHF